MEKRYRYTWEDTEDGKDVKMMIEEILADPELPSVNSIVIGCWGEAYDESCQPIVDGIVEHKEAFQGVEKLFLGDMDYEECEVSWIIQANYSKLWEAMPQLKELTIKGSQELVLGEICHENLESLTIICGGLPSSVIESIQKAKLPSLKKLILYLGSDDYGFDGNAETIRTFLEEANFPNLVYLGIVDSEIQDDVVKAIVDSKMMTQIETLDVSMGTLTDVGGQYLLDKLPECSNLKCLNAAYHYMSEEMMQKIEALPIEADVSDPQEAEEWNGKIWMSALLTE